MHLSSRTIALIISSAALFSCRERTFSEGAKSNETTASCQLGGPITMSQNSTEPCHPPIWALSDPRCLRNVNDPFELGGVMLFGPYSQENPPLCIDKSQAKPLLILAKSDAALFGFSTDVVRSDYSKNPRSEMLGTQFSAIKNIAVANIEDIDDTLVVAQIPVDSIQGVYFQIEKFITGSVSGAHAQLRISFAKPVLMRPQFPANDRSQVTESNDMILSVNAVRPTGVEFDPVHKGITNHYAVAWSGITLRERYLDSTLGQGNPTEQWRLNLTPEQAKKVLLSYLGYSEFFEYRRVYHTALQSCGTDAFFNIDSAIGPELGMKKPAAIVDRKPPVSQGGGSAFTPDNRTWDSPVFFKLSDDVIKIASAFVVKGPLDAVADMFPFNAADGFGGVPGPLRDRKLIAQGTVDKVEDLQILSPSETALRTERRTENVRKIHAELCQMASKRLAAAPQGTRREFVWKNAVKRCAQ